jgi:hypothetical protein
VVVFHPALYQEPTIIAQFGGFRNTAIGEAADRGRIVLKDKFLPKEGNFFHNGDPGSKRE